MKLVRWVGVMLATVLTTACSTEPEPGAASRTSATPVRDPARAQPLAPAVFREELDAHAIPIYALRDDLAHVIKAVGAAAPRTFDNYRIFPSFTADAVIDEARARQEKLDPRALIQADSAGGVRLSPTHRGQIYLRQLIGFERLPRVTDLGEFVDLEVDFEIEPRSPQEEAARLDADTYTNRIALHWCDDDGKPLKGVGPKMVSLFGFPSGRLVRERQIGIPVPRQARSLRVDFQLPAVDRVALRDLRLAKRGLHTEFEVEGARVAPSADGLGYRVDIPAYAEDSGRSLISQGVRGALAAVAVSVIRGDHTPRPLAEGEQYYLNSFAPLAIRLRTPEGTERLLGFDAVDGVALHFAEGLLHYRAYAYDARERVMDVIGEADPEGRREQTQLALLTRLPRAGFGFYLAPWQGTFAFPLWQPDGRLATLIFTEHADRQRTASDAVIMYGNRAQRIEPGNGFAGYAIPLTKSVFVTHAEGWLDNPERDKPWAETLSDPGFLSLMQSYSEQGVPVEFGMHTPSELGDHRAVSEDAFARLAPLRPRVWIDHGNQSNPEDLKRVGWDPASDYYIVDLLHRHGYDYAWNYLDLKRDGLGLLRDNVAANLLYHAPRIDVDQDDAWRLHLFSTKRVVFREDSLSQSELDALVATRNVCIIHCYLSYNDGGHLLPDYDDPQSLAPWFNAMLARLDALRARRPVSGDLGRVGRLRARGAHRAPASGRRCLGVGEPGAGHLAGPESGGARRGGRNHGLPPR